MHETISVTGGKIVYRHNDPQPDRPTILMIHGLGESSLCFQEAFDLLGSDFNLVAPDLPGYGRSTADSDARFSLDSQVERIRELMAALSLQRVVLVGHSLGGDLATLTCEDEPERIDKLVNVEGDLTPHDVFISSQAVEADDRGEFGSWFRNDFREDLVRSQWGSTRESCRRYYASLWFCQPKAFLANAKEIVTKNKPRSG